MSLILEALRKSEAERRRGLAPDLFVELPPVVRRRASGPTTMLWWALALAALALGTWLMRELWLPSPRTEATAAITAPGVRTGQPSSERSAVRSGAVDSAPGTADDIAPRIPVPDVMPPVAVAVPPPPAVGPTAEPAMAIQQRAVPPTPAPARESPTQTISAPAPVRAATPPASDDAAIVGLADLSADQRKQLPPLRISMHLWDQNPAHRFVIIDGARVGEGDRVGDAVIQQITPDSVLLDWNGRRLRLTLR